MSIDVFNDEMIRTAYNIYERLDFSTHCERQPGHKDCFGTTWKNPDNLAYGELGKLFFALELYRYTNDQQVWTDINDHLVLLEKYCSDNRTNNYSLFCGRFGLAFFYIELFRSSGNNSYLSKATNLAKQYFDPGSGYLKLFDNDSLIDGYPSILLFCLDLYSESGEKWVLDEIENYLRNLFNKAQIIDYGAYWNGVTGIHNRHIGWAYGCSGIAMVLLEAGKIFSNKTFFSFAELALSYEENFFSRNKTAVKPDLPDQVLLPDDRMIYSVWNQYSLLNGQAGMTLMRLYSAMLNNKKNNQEICENFFYSMGKLVSGVSASVAPLGISYGLAGWGLALRELYRLTNGDHYLRLSKKISSILVNRLNTEKIYMQADKSFFDGLSGIGYFLLKLADPKSKCSIIVPRLRDFAGITIDNLNPVGQYTGMSARQFRKWYFQKNFGRTIDLLKNRLPLEAEFFLQDQQPCLLNDFNTFFGGLDKRKMPTVAWSEINAIFKKESFILSIRRNANNSYFPYEGSFIKEIETLVEISDEELASRTLKLSGRVWIYDDSNGQDTSSISSATIISSLANPLSSPACFFRVNRFNMLEERHLGMLKIFTALFTSPATVKSVLNKVMDLVLNQDKEILSILMRQSQVDSDRELFFLLKKKVLDSIKSLVGFGVLEFSKVV